MAEYISREATLKNQRWNGRLDEYVVFVRDIEAVGEETYPLTNAYSVGGVDDGMFTVGFQQVVDEQPTVDAVSVVRCKDCKYYEQEQPGMVYCPAVVGGWVDNDWFCAGGERRENT